MLIARNAVGAGITQKGVTKRVTIENEVWKGRSFLGVSIERVAPKRGVGGSNPLMDVEK